MYARKTEDEWEIQVDYGQGWQCDTTEISFSAARKNLKLYRENMPQYPSRIVKKRVKIQEPTHANC